MSTSTATAQRQPKKFDSRAELPAMLQSRLETWRNDAPKSQFQQYGPLNAYLQGHKFPSDSFLVKPQALLRCLASDAQSKAHEGREQNPNHKSNKSRQRYSIDSHDKLVTDKKLYPDFDIDQYYSYEGDKKLTWDIIRVVVEVGSVLDGELKAAQLKVEINLKRYIGVVGNRAHRHLLGIGIVANKACLAYIKRDGWMERDLKIAGSLQWISLFDEEFVQALDKMKRFCDRDRPLNDLVEARSHTSTDLEAGRWDDSDDSDFAEDVDSDVAEDVDSDVEMS